MSTTNGSGTNGEAFALETRAEELTLLSRAKAARNGESDRLEVGRGGGSDTVVGAETLRVGRNRKEQANGKVVQAEHHETEVEGKLSLRFHSDTTLMAGAMTDVQTGAMLVLAGMSDDLCVGGGIRLTMMDLWVCGLMGMEENPMSALADAAFLEGYRTHFEREYGAGIHLVGSATFTGSLHCTMATGFRALSSVAMGVRNMTPGAGSADAGDATAPPAAPPPPADPPPPPDNNSQVLTTVDDAAQVDEITQVDEGVEAARYVEPQAVEGAGDAAGPLEDAKNADPNPPPDYPAPRPPGTEDVDDAARYADTEIYATVTLPGFDDGRFEFEKTDWELGIINPNGSLDGFEEGIIPGWLTETEYDDLIPRRPLTADPYEAPTQVVTLPEDFDYAKALDDFNNKIHDEYRRDTVPGLAIMQTANNEVGELPWDELRRMDPEWLADAGVGADELAELKMNPTKAYQKIADMEAAARQAGDIEKADELRRTLDYIDKRTFVTIETATKAAEAVRPTGFLPIPGNFNADSAIEELENALANLQLESAKAVEDGDMDRVNEIAQKSAFYITAIDVLKNGNDPTPYINELFMTAKMNAGSDAKRLGAINAGHDEVFNILGSVDHLFDKSLPNGFKFDVGDVATGQRATGYFREIRGIPAGFDYNQYRNYLLNLIENAGDADVTELRNALEKIEDGPLAQLDALPAGYIEEAGMWQQVADAKASQDPLAAYRVLEQMEAFFRQLGDADSAHKADAILSMLENIDAMTIDEYTKVYDLVEQIATGQRAAGTSVPFIPAPRTDLPTGADDATELDNVRQQADVENVYDLLARQDVGADEAATFDDVQAALGLNPNQVDVETAVGEEPIYALATGANDYENVVIRSSSGGEPIYENVSDYQNAWVVDEVESNYSLVGYREDRSIYGDFQSLSRRERIGLGTAELQFPADTDGYKLKDKLLTDAKNKYKAAGDWTTEASNHKRFFDMDSNPLLVWDPARQEHVLEGADGVLYKWGENSKGEWVLVPVDPVNVPPPPPPPPDSDPDAVWFFDEASKKHVLVDEADLPPPPPPLDNPEDVDAYFKYDPETGKVVKVDDVDVPPAPPQIDNPPPTSLDTDGQAFSGYFNPQQATVEDVATPSDDIYEITRRRIDFVEEGAYNSLVFGFQQQAPDSIYSRLDETKLSTDFVQAPTNGYANVGYDNARSVVVQSLDNADDIAMPPPVQPGGLDRPGKITVWIDSNGELVTAVDFADDVLPVLPPVTSDATESLYQSLGPVMVNAFEQGTGPTIARGDGTTGVIEAAWTSADPIVTVLNREPHQIAADAFESLYVSTDLPRVNEALNSMTYVQQPGGTVFSLGELGNIQDLQMLDENMWQLAADPVLNPKLHEMSTHGDDLVASVLGRGGATGGARPRW